MNRRAAVLALVLFAAGIGRLQLQAVEPAPARELDLLPLELEEWQGRPGPPFEPAVLDVLKADDHLNRLYSAGGTLTGLFVGYYRSQRFGVTIHSPLNCLPGAGWQPVSSDRVAFAGGTLNQVLIRKGDDRQVVLYWYQTLRRVEGNEYWSKWHLVTDAFTSRRNDAALVRVVAPVDPRRADGEAVAARAAHRLAELVQPRVSALLFN